MTTTTPNMNMVLPSVSVTPGPTWANELNAALTLNDAHDHSTGKGVSITPSGLNINADLTFASNNATNLRTARFVNNSSFTPGANDLGCLYELNNELYYRDGAGNAVQITLSGAVDVSGSVTALSLKDSNFILQYFGDVTRQFRFNGAAIAPSTTIVLSTPAASDTLAGLVATQTFTNKTLGVTNTLTGATMASLTPNGTNTLTFPAITDTMVTKTTTDVLTNKTLTAPIMSSDILFNEISTPSNPSSGVLAVYAKSDNNLYSLNSSGLEQQIGAGGSGGAINYISNNGFENGTVTGWATYSGGTTTPTSGTGGSPVTTFTISSISPLRGSYDGLWSKSANNRQGEGFSYAFTLANADLGKTLQITFDSIASSNMVTGDMTIWVYDVTNSVLITPSSINVPTGTSSQYSVVFQATTGTSYRLIFHTSTTSALAYTLHVDQLSISPIVRPMVAGESDWVTYTPTISAGFGTVTNNSAFWRRIGDSMSVMGSFTAGTLASSIASISLPGSFTINSSKLSINNSSSAAGNAVGFYGASNAGSGGFESNIVTAPTTSTSLVYAATIASNGSPLTPSNANNSVAVANQSFSYQFILPITQWSSNITLASTTPMIEYVYNTSGTTTAGGSDTTSFGYGAVGAAIGSIASTTVTGQSVTTMRVRFQNAIQPTDRVQLEIQNANSNEWMNSGSTALVGLTQSTAQYGVTINVQNSTDVNVAFGNGGAYPTSTYAAAGAAWSTLTSYKWRVAKYSSIGGAELAPATITSTGTISRENIWTAYTPTISAGFGTVTNNSAYYKILGDSCFIRGSFTTGTPAASLSSISIPTVITMSSSKLSLSNTTSNPGNVLGQYGIDGVALGRGYIISATGTSTTLIYCGQSLATGSSPVTPQTGTAILASTSVFSYQFEVPIV
jgi:hypothetical protein